MWAGVVVTVLPGVVSPAAGADQTTAFIGLVGSAALVAAALWLEHCCKTRILRSRMTTSASVEGPIGSG
ncbi:DUF3180 family protein [Kutzneria sp. 744]|uniref:DUF3180 family protein n=1 Tax=Kutzneria sp. (strain 744) TaxID=345341 RepID=UPI0021015DFD|nr:DUF3180 family protein [Kutzneria sp. 744]